ncbi:MAG: four-carbon acid sugar kinase family protein, partial [Rhodobacteraceae bacterium]|nr:four-carbon acid sugar kinase family protein [Paracoccaceae bacterium]
MILGAIGDDFTGSSDLGLMLSKGGMKTEQYVGVPQTDAAAGVEAGIVALKTRSVPPADAVAQSLAALDWLRAQGCRCFYFKYCSTFDSTREGNIGPVLDALIAALGTDAPVLVCPAFPVTGRTIYQGHLFVVDKLLSESGMENHPLTPMTDPDIRRWLALQTRTPVGHLPIGRLRAGQGTEALRAEAA